MNMSFMLTTEQYENRTKTETRRLGWRRICSGQIFMGVKKGQGLKKGEKVQKLHASQVTSAHIERLNQITQEGCVKEGFPHLTPEQFVEMFCQHNKCKPDALVTVIAFKHLP
jgi:hypothetical protein